MLRSEVIRLMMMIRARREKRRTGETVDVIVIATARSVMVTVIATVNVIATVIANAKSVGMTRRKALRWRIAARSARSVMEAPTRVNVVKIGTGAVVVQRRRSDQKKALSFATCASISLQLV